MEETQKTRKKMRYGKLYGVEGDEVLASGAVLITRKESALQPTSYEMWFMPGCILPISTDTPCRLRLSEAVFWEVRLVPSSSEQVFWEASQAPKPTKLSFAAGMPIIPPHYKLILADSRWDDAGWFDSLTV
jgi:hypothetical protein